MTVLAPLTRSSSYSHPHRTSTMKRRRSLSPPAHPSTFSSSSSSHIALLKRPRPHLSSLSRTSRTPLPSSRCPSTCLFPLLHPRAVAVSTALASGVAPLRCRIRLPDRSTTVITLDSKHTVRTLRILLADRMGVTVDKLALYGATSAELSDTLQLTLCHITNSTTLVSGWKQGEGREGLAGHAVWDGKRSVLSRIDE